MSKTLIIAEKPSVAKDIASALGVPKVGEVYENADLVISNCIGHLVELFSPEAENRSAPPPIIPRPFLLRATQDTASQFNLVKRLMARPDVSCVANACDAGREGEAIFRLVYELAGCKKKMERLWLQSMTKGGIKTAWDNREPGANRDDLADAARSRAEADFLVGINGTRVFYHAVGRVMTPTLALVVDRFLANRDFKAKDYFEVAGTFGLAAGVFKAKWVQPTSTKQIEDISVAEAIVAKCKSIPPSSITDESKPTKSSPPFLFDLTSLQREANKRFKFSAKKTLDIAQALYEKHKVTSYPRTDSQRLPEDYVGQCGNILKSLAGMSEFGALAQKPVSEGWVKPNKRIFDDSKISDHFAIIPMGVVPSGLSADEDKIFTLVSRRFVAIFYPDAEYTSTTRTTVVASEVFRTSGRVLVKRGWLEVDGKAESGDDKEPPLPKMDPGEAGKNIKIEVVALKTKAPALYTEATLLTAMETAGKALDDDELADAMKERGLGTPATRASMIEKLLFAGKSGPSMVRDSNNLVPTEKGIAIIERLKKFAPKLVSPILTGEWENKLLQMEKGKFSRTNFMAEIESFVLELVANGGGGSGSGSSRGGQGGEKSPFSKACPGCGGALVFDGRTVRHDEPGACEFVMWATVSKREISLPDLESLVEHGELPVGPGFKTKDNRPFSAGMKLNKKTGKVEFVFEKGRESNISCPRCGKKASINGKKVECDCGFSMWTTIAGVQLTEDQIKELITNGKTGPLSGFTSKKGSKFDASLLFDKEKELVSFDFSESNSQPKEKHKDGQKCPTCKKGKLGYRKNKDDKSFLGCSGYPACKFFEWA